MVGENKEFQDSGGESLKPQPPLQSELMYAQLLDSVADMVLVKGPGSRIVYANKAFRDFYGMSMEELTGLIDAPFNQKGFTQQYLEDDAYVFNTGTTLNIPEEPVTRHDGQIFIFHTIKSPIFDDQGNVVMTVGVSRDITGSKQADATIKELNTSLEQQVLELAGLAEKLQHARDEAVESARLKSEFVANISHEIRTPISALIGLTELLLDTQLTSGQRELLELTFDSAKALLTIINDILDFSKIEASKINLEEVTFSLSRVISGAVELLAEAAHEKDLSLSYNFDAEIPQRVQGDPVRLRQVLLNLISNAIKFTDRGAIQIRAMVASREANKINIRFEVHDTGIGLSEESREKLFKPFTQIDSSSTRKYGGTGLGLAICKRLVELMGGDIGVESEVGTGSTFWFTVPYSASQKTADYTDSSGFAGQHNGQLNSNAKVLLVEDNPVLQKLAARQLERLGYHPHVVTTGKEAIAAVAADTYDLVLMDCQLPEMDGYEATRAIRQLESENIRRTPIIAMTASAMFGDQERCLEAGMDDYLAKPVSMDKLNNILLRWVSRPEQATESQ